MDVMRTLLKLQNVERTVDQMKLKLSNLGVMQRLETQKRRLIHLKQLDNKVANRVSELQKSIREAEQGMKKLSFLIKENERELYSGRIGNVKELDYLQQQIIHDKNSLQTHETELLQMMEELERLNEEQVSLEENIRRETLLMNEVEKEAWSELKSLESDTAQLMDKRESLMAEIDQTLLREYKQKREKLHGVVVCEIGEDRICQGCHTRVSYNVLKHVRQGERVRCEGCGRYLVSAM